MPKFALFWGIPYYPIGGMWDFEGIFDSVDIARSELLRILREEEDIRDPSDVLSFNELDTQYWYQIVDINTMKVVEAKGSSCYGKPETFNVK